MIGAGKSTNEVFPLAAFLPKTRVRSSSFEKQTFTGALAWLSSTARWGCGYRCDGTASGPLVGLDYADQRWYSSTLGRFATPDPTALNIAFEDPRTWNLYAYSGNDPVNANDPTGLCSVFIAGITQSYDPGGAFSQIANAAGAEEAYGYAGLDGGNSVLSVARQDADAIGVALAALRDALGKNGGMIDVVAYSGGASAFTGAYNLLSGEEQKRIGNIVYVSPGANGEIATNGSTSVLIGSGVADRLATFATTVPVGTPFTETQCAHTDFACFVRAGQNQFKAIQDDGSCWNASVASPVKGGSRGNTPGVNPLQNLMSNFTAWMGSITTTTYWSETIFRPDRN